MARRTAVPPWGWATTLVVGATLSTAGAIPPGLVGAVPADAWIVVAIDGGASSSATAALHAAAFLLDQARRIGLASNADSQVRATMDVIGSLPVVIRHPYAVCVLDATATPLAGGGHRLAELRGGVIVHTCGDNAALEARVQHLLNTYVNNEIARCETIRSEGRTSYRLIDERLPLWAQMEWGAVEDCYVLALGSGVFERIAATVRARQAALTSDDWFAAAHRRCRGDHAYAEWAVRFDRIRDRLQPIMAGKPEEVLAGLGLGEVQRGLWTVGVGGGSDGRAVQAYAVLQNHDGDRFLPICHVPDAVRPGRVEAPIPPQASRYAVVRYSPRRLVFRVRDAYLASRSPSAQRNLREMWARVEAETNVSVDRDLLMQLGPRIVVHDYPPHPLDLPLLRTVLIEINGSSLAVRTCLDRLLRRYRDHLGRPSPDWTSLRLEHASDGVWYLQAGLYGPALAVTDRWVIISYSPVAVRQNIAFLEARPDEDGDSPGPEREAP